MNRRINPITVLGGFLFVIVLVVLDQATKIWVEVSLPFQVRVPVLPFLSWFRTYNEGIAFSFLSFMNDQALVILTVVIIVFVLWLWSRTEPERKLTHLGYALVIGGALGNLIDRALLGHVVDFVMFHTTTWSFAIFNLADTFITIGAVTIILDEFLDYRKSQNANPAPPGKDN